MENDISENYRFDSIRQNFKVGFGIFKRNWLFLLKANLIPFFLTLPLIFVAVSLAIFKNDVANFYIGFLLCVYYIFLLISLIFYGFNYQLSLYKIYDGEKITFGELFKRPDSRIFLMIIASFIIAILIEIGFVLFIIPGFYFAYRYAFVIDLILDKNKSLSEAMELSSKMTKGKKNGLFFYDIKIFIINILALLIGILCLFVGLIPVAFILASVGTFARINIYRNLYNSLEIK